MNDQWHAYVQSDLELEPTGKGVLEGMTFSVKDVFDIQYYINTAGNPDWHRSHNPAMNHAPVIHRLLDQGARLKGVTHTDELMFSLDGENAHYGTPINPHDKDRIPGGSSSGSAVSVATGLSDFALGTDTGGSVRIPSAYCGIFGFRPTHGLVNIDGVIPLAKSFDTVGWMARSSKTLEMVGQCLIPEQIEKDSPFDQFIFPKQIWELTDERLKESLFTLLHNADMTEFEWVEIEGIETWNQVFRQIQGIEIWAEHGEWIRKEQPTFGPGVKERFEWVSTLDEHKWKANMIKKERIATQLADLLGDDGLLIIPTTPGEPPFKNTVGEENTDRRKRTMQFTSIAGLSGMPQITIPAAQVDGLPIGLSMIASHKQDLRLLKWVNQFVNRLEKQEVTVKSN